MKSAFFINAASVAKAASHPSNPSYILGATTLSHVAVIRALTAKATLAMRPRRPAIIRTATRLKWNRGR